MWNAVVFACYGSAHLHVVNNLTKCTLVLGNYMV